MLEWINFGLIFLNILIVVIIIILYVKINTIITELSDKYLDQKDMVINIRS